MTGAEITAICTGAATVIASVAALVAALRTGSVAAGVQDTVNGKAAALEATVLSLRAEIAALRAKP